MFKTGADLVRVDVVVLDRQGEPVTSLTAGDFELQEEGVAQEIRAFQFVKADGHPAANDEVSLVIRSRSHAASEAARDNVRLFLIFWDEYHIGQMASATRARNALTQFVRTAFGPTDIVAFMDPLTPIDAITFTRDRLELVRADAPADRPLRRLRADAQRGRGRASRARRRRAAALGGHHLGAEGGGGASRRHARRAQVDHPHQRGPARHACATARRS